MVLFGLLNINKPSGPTSHDIVAGVRRALRKKRVGHAGTLDPLASGVLVVALGPATRLTEYLTASEKTYRADIRLGITTSTYDAEGEVTSERPLPLDLTRKHVETALKQFRGEIQQVPPVFSAIKVGGKSAHARVRAGQEVQLTARPVTIHRLEIIDFQPPVLKLEIVCSPGTYIRSLAHDLGQVLATGGMLSRLVRTASGSFRVEEAITWDRLQSAMADGSWQNYLIPADQALRHTVKIQLNSDNTNHIMHGRPISDTQAADILARAYTPNGQFIAVLQGDPRAGCWWPIKVFSDLYVP